MHEDFAKIRANMLDSYGEKEGESVYHAWLKKCGYDDSKPMKGQSCREMQETEGCCYGPVVVAEKFEWTMPFRYYDIGQGVIIRGEALHPGVTKNKQLYMKDDLVKGARSLIGARLEFLEHGSFLESGNDVLDAEFVEPDKVEYVARVLNAKAVEAVRKGDITHVSPSIICRKAIKLDGGVKICEGAIFNGLCLVHRNDPAGPGDVRTTVTVWETCPDRLEPPQGGPETDSKCGLNMSEKNQATVQPPSPSASIVTPSSTAQPSTQMHEQVEGHGPVAGVPEPSIEDRVKTLEEQFKNFQQYINSDISTIRAQLQTLIDVQPAIASNKGSETVNEARSEKPAEQNQEKTGPSQMQEKTSPPPSGQGITKPVGELPHSQPGTVAVAEIRKVFDDPRLFTPQLREKAILQLIGEEDNRHD